MRNELAGVVSLLLLHSVLSAHHGAVGTISAFATQTRTYSETVKLSYFEPVNCTLVFDEDVGIFTAADFAKDDTTVISNFLTTGTKEYTFQVSSTVNANVTLSIPAGTVQTTAGIYNNETTAIFSFEFYAFPPSVTLLLDGFEAQSTRRDHNIAYLSFNSTTQYDDDTRWFNASFVSISPALAVTDFEQVNDKMYRFQFSILKNESYPEIECIEHAVFAPTTEHSVFACDTCPRPLLCTSRTTYPPVGVAHMEFPFNIVLQPVPELGLPSMNLPMIYDTLWGYVQMDAPLYANDPFYVVITWSEPLIDLVAVLPTFDPTGPPVDQELLKRNLTVLSPTSFRLLVAPKRTGVLKISIQGSRLSIDMAGNTNDNYRNPASFTSDMRTVIFSAGPPLPGTIDFRYDRPRLVGEYPPVPGPTGFQLAAPASLTASWSGFLTATHYDAWVKWGQNWSTPEVIGLNVTEFTFEDFSAMLGVEYQVYIRAFNYFGESTTVVRTFLHPLFYFSADGSYSLMALPDMLSPTEKRIPVNVLIPEDTFLSINTLKVLSFRAPDRSAGDTDPCMENSRMRKCTYLNFHIEVPASQFIVFRRPIRLQFIFGRDGWSDIYFRPRLYYWETHEDRWTDVASTCSQEQRYDSWNELHRIYEVAVCHLSYFAVFGDFAPPASTTTAQAPPRPESYGGATFFIVLAGVVVCLGLVCCVCYFACVQQNSRRYRRPLAYKDMGIKPVNERIPSRGLGSPSFGTAAIEDAPDASQDDSLLVALPAPGQHVRDHMILALPAPEVPYSSSQGNAATQQELPTSSVSVSPRPAQAEEEYTPHAELEPLGRGLGGFGVVPADPGLPARAGSPQTQALPNNITV
jgi:hypothetical protein